MAKHPETTLTQLMLGLLRVRGILAFRRNVAGARKFTNERNGKSYWVNLGAKGEADIWGILPDGRHLELEVKMPGKMPTQAQYDWLRTVAKAGGIALWADDINQLNEYLRLIARSYRPIIGKDGCMDFKAT